MEVRNPNNEPRLFSKLLRKIIGGLKDIEEPSLFRKISLIPLLAWIGLGADGLSSSSYGPEEAFRALGPHTYLAFFLALATAVTVFVIFLIFVLITLNLRGVKESVTVLAPIFFIFLMTHILLIGNGVFSHLDQVASVAADFQADLRKDLSSIGFIGATAVFLRAFSIGGGTYTGIEAVSNGIQIMREPKVQTGKRTMAYMAISLAIMPGGLLLCYSLFIRPTHGRTMNALLSDAVFSDWPLGNGLALVTIFSEGMLLVVAAQAGFVDGPRVMANMAIDFWLPRRFAALSERLTMQNGVLLMGGAAFALLIYTGGHRILLCHPPPL
jgi:amino acid transporter